jgi:integrase
MSTYDVRVWSIRKRDRPKPYQVRWAVAGKPFADSFMAKALADSFRSELIAAARSGEPFDTVTGLPESRARDVSWYEHAASYMDAKWPRLAAKSRTSTAEALTSVTLALLLAKRGRPADPMLRQALFTYGFNVAQRRTGGPAAEIAAALEWVRSASRPVSSLRDLSVLRDVLDAISLRLDGRPAAATTVYRKRAVFYNALGLAVERRLLPSNPIDMVQWSTPTVADAVDRRVVASPAQVRALLDAVERQPRRGAHLVAFFGCLYYAGMRPSEAVALRDGDCVLPDSGWGRLLLTRAEPLAGQRWTDDGRVRETRPLKRRATNQVRPVPIPPELVVLMRRHLDRHGVGSDGRVFRNERGGSFNEARARLAWSKARSEVLTQGQVASPLARRPYDLRHAAASLWLNGGVPATEVASRLGHDVAVLLRVYANCIDGQEAEVNDRIAAALGSDSGYARVTSTAGSGKGNGNVVDHTWTRGESEASLNRKTAGQPS